MSKTASPRRKPWSRNGIKTSLSRTILPLNQATRSLPRDIGRPLALFGRLRDRLPMEILRQPGFRDGTMLGYVRQYTVYELAHRDQPLNVDPGVEAHRLEHEGKILGDDVAGGAGGIGATAEPAQ